MAMADTIAGNSAFSLKMTKKGLNMARGEMTGMFESQGEAPVTFRRKQELVS